MTKTDETENLALRLPPLWRALSMLDTGGRACRADLVLDVQGLSITDLVYVETRGFIEASRRGQRWHAVKVVDTIARGLDPHEMLLKLTREGRLAAHAPENQIRRAFRSGSERASVWTLSHWYRLGYDQLNEMREARQIRLFLVDEEQHETEIESVTRELISQASHRVHVQLTVYGRSMLPRGGFR